MISVCMATYNGSIYIKEQIDSIISQLSESDELVISDDGSSDDTVSIIKSYNDDRIILLHNAHENGYKKNFETALENAHGDYIFLSDQDDIWYPNKVKVIMSTLSRCDLVVHDALLVNSEGKSMGKNYFSLLHSKTTFLANLWKTRFLGCCMAFNRKVLDDCLPFPNLVDAHDYWLGMYALVKYKVLFINDILVYYRRHNSTVSPSGGKSNTSLYYKLFVKRIPLLFSILRKVLF